MHDPNDDKYQSVFCQENPCSVRRGHCVRADAPGRDANLDARRSTSLFVRLDSLTRRLHCRWQPRGERTRDERFLTTCNNTKNQYGEWLVTARGVPWCEISDVTRDEVHDCDGQSSGDGFLQHGAGNIFE